MAAEQGLLPLVHRALRIGQDHDHHTSWSRSCAERGSKLEVLDGDIVRENLSKGLGFSKEDRDTNIRRIAFVADLLSRNEVPVITAAISPYREIRDEARAKMDGRFIEVYVKASVEDVRGARRQGPLRQGALRRDQGVHRASPIPTRRPENPELVIETEEQTPEESAQQILDYLEEQELIPPQGAELGLGPRRTPAARRARRCRRRRTARTSCGSGRGSPRSRSGRDRAPRRARGSARVCSPSCAAGRRSRSPRGRRRATRLSTRSRTCSGSETSQ